jgi:DNA invertase Pin-like site-specific DNA recombinase
MMNQIEKIRKTVGENKGFLKAIYADYGLSGKNTEGRPAFKKLEEDVQPGENIVCYDIWRLGRDTADNELFKKKMEKQGSVIYTADDGQSSDTIEGEMVMGFKSVMGKALRRKTVQNIEDSMGSASARGELRPRTPYGYTFVAKGLPLQRNEREQEVIQKIRDLRDANPSISVNKICKILNAENLGDLRKAKEWHFTTVERIMRREGMRGVVNSPDKYKVKTPGKK